MAKILYLRDGPVGNNITRSITIAINDIKRLSYGGPVRYFKSLPEINSNISDSLQGFSGPSYVVVEVCEDDEVDEIFSRPGFYSLNIYPSEVTKQLEELGILPSN